MTIVYLNGDYLPLENARVSVLDRGFTFADAVYEVIPVYGEHIFRLPEHLSRLQNSLQEIYIENPCTDAEWQQIFDNILHRNPLGNERSLYIQISRGVGEREHLDDSDLTPTVFVMCRAIKQKDYQSGVSAITHEDIRWQYCHIKATTLLASILLKRRARDRDGSAEAILVRDGRVTEGASSNVFIVSAGVVSTTEKDGSVLPGITRDLLVELLQTAGIPCLEQSVTVQQLRDADEVWLTSSTMGIMPVVSIDGSKVGQGVPGELWQQANALYQNFKDDPQLLP